MSNIKISPSDIADYPGMLSENLYGYTCPIIRLYQFFHNKIGVLDVDTVRDILTKSARYKFLLPLCFLNKKCRRVFIPLLSGNEFCEQPILVIKVDGQLMPGGDGHHRICMSKRFNIPSISVLVWNKYPGDSPDN